MRSGVSSTSEHEAAVDVAHAEQARRFDTKFYKKLVIRDKAARTISLELNSAQVKVLDVVKSQRDAGLPVRIVCLKARQFGGSTLFQAMLYCDARFRPNRENLVVAHSLKGAENLMAMSRRFFARMSDDLSSVPVRSNAGELVFPNGSRMVVDTAGNVEVGRSFTLHGLHASEVAFWNHADERLLALLQAVPDHPDTAVFIESTANGIGDPFHRLWRDASEGRSTFKPVFVGWNFVAEYSTEFSSDKEKAAFESSLSEEEISLMFEHKLPLEQLHWRRRTINTKCGGNVEHFRQEYPINDVEAFVASGRPIFHTESLTRRYHNIPAPAFRGEIVEGELVPAAHGRLSVWKHPEPDMCCVLGVDVAQGLLREGAVREPDRSCIQLLDRRTLEQLACWNGHIAPEELARVARDLAVLYGNALVAVEANNHGLTTLTELQRIHVNIYYRPAPGSSGASVAGWLTTARTRPLMLDGLARALREESLVLNDSGTVAECLSFAAGPDGRPAALPGCHDDRVIALAIALAVHSGTPLPRLPDAADRKLDDRLRQLEKLRRAGRGASVAGWTVL